MRITLFTLAMFSLACTGPRAQDDEAGTTTNPSTSDDEASDASEATGTSTSTTTTTATATEGTSTSEESFLIEYDVMPRTECDVFAQDCPDGEKCVPYSSTGDLWNANKCVPVLGDQAPGEACTWAGIAEATDDCDASSICWYAQLVGDQYVGTCVAQCTGSVDDPMCANGSTCALSDDGPLALCLPTCDPLVQDCDEGLGCYWANFAFNCTFTTENLPTGEPCGYANDCAPGHLCADAAMLPSCAGAACCTQYCNLLEGDAGCVGQPGTVCSAFFEMGTAPAGYENVGICILPP